MGYEHALKCGGYKVLDYKKFGYYQGSWVAILEDGGVITDYYGSCCGCDSLESFLSKLNEDPTDDDYKNFCLEQAYTAEYIYPVLFAKCKWDSDSTEILDWLKQKLAERGFLKDAT